MDAGGWIGFGGLGGRAPDLDPAYSIPPLLDGGPSDSRLYASLLRWSRSDSSISVSPTYSPVPSGSPAIHAHALKSSDFTFHDVGMVEMRWVGYNFQVYVVL